MLTFNHVIRLKSEDLLNSAWQGSLKLAADSGVDIAGIPSLDLSSDTRDTQFTQAFRRLASLAKGNVSEDTLVRAALSVMAASTGNSHTAFIPPEHWDQLSEGRHMPIFLFRTIPTTEGPMVWDVVQGSMADKAGIQKGDILKAINGRSVLDQESARITRSKQEFLISRNGMAVPQFSVRIEPETIEPFQAKMIGDIAYLYLYSFPLIDLRSGQHSFVQELRASLTALTEKNPRGWILDLRSNRGGSPDCVALVAGAFGFKGVVFAADQKGGRVQSFASPGGDFVDGRPVIVLTDQYTGSGAEILAAVLQESNIARVVGVRSAGHVMLSRRYALRGGGGLQIAVATVRAGQNLQLEGTGVIPDIEVSLSSVEILTGRDAQLETALDLLRGTDKGGKE